MHAATAGHVGVVVEVALQDGERRLGRVDGVDRRRPAGRGVDREPTGRREHVEHPLPAGELADGESIEPLIEEVAGLLAGLDVGFEREVAFAEQDRSVGDLTDDHVAVVETVALERLQVAGEPQHDRVDARRGEHAVDDRTQVGIPDLAVELDHADVVVAVDHESRKAVVLAVDGAIAGAVHRTTAADVAIEEDLASGHRLGDPFGEPTRRRRSRDRRRGSSGVGSASSGPTARSRRTCDCDRTRSRGRRVLRRRG